MEPEDTSFTYRVPSLTKTASYCRCQGTVYVNPSQRQGLPTPYNMTKDLLKHNTTGPTEVYMVSAFHRLHCLVSLLPTRSTNYTDLIFSHHSCKLLVCSIEKARNRISSTSFIALTTTFDKGFCVLEMRHLRERRNTVKGGVRSTNAKTWR